MKISYNEFHISKEIRDICNFDEQLFASTGNVILANMKNVRNFALKYNSLFDKSGEENKKISAGQLNAMGLIDEILHHVCMLYRRDKSNSFFKDLIAELENALTKEVLDELLLDFTNEFPPTQVYKGNCSAQEYLNQTAIEDSTGEVRTNREQTLEELIMLHLANENPAFKPFKLLFDDENLAKKS